MDDKRVQHRAYFFTEYQKAAGRAAAERKSCAKAAGKKLWKKVICIPVENNTKKPEKEQNDRFRVKMSSKKNAE